MTETQTPSAAPSRGLRKVRTGTVVSGSMDKTVVVSVVDLKQHPVYKKVIRRNTRFMAHDEANECGVGDRVRIMETRPLSKLKRWRVVEVLEKAR
jgi:small subunit ribosomal protein S17